MWLSSIRACHQGRSATALSPRALVNLRRPLGAATGAGLAIEGGRPRLAVSGDVIVKAKSVGALLLAVAGIWLAQAAAQNPREGDKGGKGVPVLDSRKIEEGEAKNKLDEPNYGYVGTLGTFSASAKKAGAGTGEEAAAAFVVHQYPDVEKSALGLTKLQYEGPKRLGNVDGWVFKTEWDGKQYPSKVFLSAEKVYFGGGESAYIAADHRTDTGWVWKLMPLRRMEMLKKSGAEGR